MATGRQGCPSRLPVVTVGASPAPQSALKAFMVKMSPPTNHIAGTTRVNEQNNEDMALIQ